MWKGEVLFRIISWIEAFFIEMESLDKLKSILFYDLCRLCLENAGAEDMFTKAELVRDIFLCTGVIVRIFN